MAGFELTKTPIGVYIVTPTQYSDNRGYFMETYNYRALKEAGLDAVFVQDNQSCSKKGVLRGLHFQNRFPQGKLIRVITGEIFDVAVDLRPESQTYGQWFGLTLSDRNRKQLFIPEGFAHGFLAVSEEATIAYKCTDFYYPEYEDGIIWNDPTLAIAWPLERVNELIISDKDKNLKKFNKIERNKLQN